MKTCKHLSLLLAAVLVLTLLLPTVTTVLAAQQDAPPQAGSYYQLVNKQTGTLLTETDDDSYTPAITTYRVAVRETSGGDNQVWQVSERRNGLYGLISGDSGMSLHKTQESDDRIPGSSPVVTVMTNSDSAEQVWKLIDAGGGYFRIESNFTPGQSLAATEFVPQKDGVGLEVAAVPTSGEDARQLWKFVEVEGPEPDPLPDIDPIFPLDPVEPQPYKLDNRLHRLDAGEVELGGYTGELVDYVMENQLKTTDWRRMVDQFRLKTDADQAFRGEFWGKLMRGASLHYRYSLDPDLYRSMEYSVRDLLSTQDEHGRISTYPIDRELSSWDMWCRKYVMLGLEAFYEICPDEQLKADVLKALCIHADYILTKIGLSEEGKIPINLSVSEWQGLPASSILEPMAVLYRLTGYQRYLDFSTYIVEEGGSLSANIFELAYENQLAPYQYLKNSAKAYEMSSCFEGLAEYAQMTGNEKWKTAVVNYCMQIIDTEITLAGSGGGDGPDYNVRDLPGGEGEQWNRMADEQTHPDAKHIQETCVTVTWMKLCERALRLTEDPRLADEIEKTVYNALLGAIKGETAAGASGPAADYLWDYFSLLNGTRNNNGGGMIPGLYSCCPANGPSATGLIPFVQVMDSEAGPVVNLYNPGTARTETPLGQQVVITTETEYPREGNILLAVDPESEEEFTVKLRIPAWSAQTTVAVNGQSVGAVQPGSYLALTRSWAPGDKIQLVLDLRTRVVESPQGQKSDAGDYTALLRGPILLARDARFQDGSVLDIVQVQQDADGYAAVQPSGSRTFDNHMEFIVSTEGGGSFRVTDYASAGSTWTEESQYASWLPAVSKEPEPEIKEGTEYFLYSLDRGRVATADAQTGNAYAEDSLFPANQNKAQAWTFEPAGEGLYRIQNAQTSAYLTLDPSGISTEGCNIYTQPKLEGSHQLWRMLKDEGRNAYSIVNVASGYVLSIAGDGNNLHQWGNAGVAAQYWTLEKRPADPEPIDTDKAILKAVIDYALSAKQNGEFDQAIESVQRSFDAALSQAQSVLDRADATQQQVDEAWTALMREIHKLGFVKGDKAALEALITLGNSFHDNIGSYTPATAQPFTAALAAAQAVFGDQDALQDEVDAAHSALLDAMMNLRYKADKSILEAVLARADKIDLSVYTQLSAAVFASAKAEAQAALNDQDAEQARVDEATNNLQAAIDQLACEAVVPAPTVNGDTSLTGASSSPKTGDTAPLAAGFALLALIGAACAVASKRKR